MPLHIGIAGPIATDDVRALLDAPDAALPAGYGGAPLLGTLIAALLQAGHRVSAFTLSRDLPLHDGLLRRAGGPGFTLNWVPMRPRAWPFNGRRPGRIVDLYAFERAGLANAIESAAPDLVHAHWCYEFAAAALRSGLPHLVTCHDSPLRVARYQRDLRHGGYRWLRALMAWQVLRRSRHVSTVSPYMVGEVQPWCRVPVELVPNPLPGRALALPRRAEPGRARVLMVCNGWNALKNPEPALRAFAAAARHRPGCELVLLGHDFGPGGLAQQWWQAQGLQAPVNFVGPLPHDQVLDWMTRSEVLLHPSREESFGAIVAEAMAAGLAVIAGRDSGALPWLVGDAGRLVDVGSVAEIAQALLGLLGDAAGAARLGDLARASVQRRFDAPLVAAQYLALYRRVLSRPQARPAAEHAA